MAKRVLIFLGSPRKEGNSAILAGQVAEGAESAEGKIEKFFLHDMNIQPCDACEACRDRSDTNCILDDDMKEVFPKLREADVIVIAGPVYWFTVSAQTKLFMDRWYALGGPEGHAFKGKRFGIVLTYADTDPFSSGAVNALRTFQDALNYVGASVVGMVYGSAWEAGEIKKNKELLEKAFNLGKQLAAD
ncbi:MAG TPA: flavodoxin family protein [Thermodesulfobacteriota bacterium]|nr:flavodoxin family protein [Thermodesulfobacteriota bacterium]